MNYFLFNLICVILVNVILYLSINVNQFFFYILVSLFFLLFSFILSRIIKLESYMNDKKKHQDQIQVDSSETADDHPIIQSARKRLGK